jgi:voltage-gated potassium channel
LVFELMRAIRRLFWRHRRIVIRLTVVGVVAMFVGTVLFYIIENPAHGEDVSWWESFWSVFFTIISADFVDVTPTTALGRVLITLLVLFGIGFVGLVTASIASILVVDELRVGKGMKRVKLKDHVVVCGWNYNAEAILREIFAASKGIPHVVVVADLEETPLQDEDFFFHYVRGDITEETTLKRASIEDAKNAIVLADTSGGRPYDEADSRTILAVLTIETLNPDVYTCAELVHAKNSVHLERVNVDEIILSGEYGGKMLAHAAMSHGISKVVSHLLTADEGHEMYKVAVPKSMVEKPFDDLILHFRKEYRALPLALIRGADEVINPPVDFVVKAGDELVVIAEEQPKIKG